MELSIMLCKGSREPLKAKNRLRQFTGWRHMKAFKVIKDVTLNNGIVDIVVSSPFGEVSEFVRDMLTLGYIVYLKGVYGENNC